MPDLNEVVYGGRMVSDPKFYPVNKNGEPHKHDRAWVVIASNPPTKREDVPAAFMAICAWGPNARLMSQYGEKGKDWTVTGSLKTQRREAPDGTVYTYSEITVRRHIMGPRAKNKPQSAPADSEAAEGTSSDSTEVLKKLEAIGVTPDQLAAALKGTAEKESDQPF